MVNTYRGAGGGNSIMDWMNTQTYGGVADPRNAVGGGYRNAAPQPNPGQMGGSAGGADPFGGRMPTGSGGSTGFGSTGLAGNAGWAGTQGYDRMQLSENIYDNPEWILPDVFSGLDTQGPGYAMLADLPFDPQLLYSLAQYGAGGGGLGTAGPDAYANFLNQMYTGIGGGQYIDFGEVLNMLGGGDSELSYWLDNAPPSEVMGFLKGVLGTAAQGLDSFGQNVVYTMMPGMFAQQGNQLLKTSPQDTGNVNPYDAFQRGLATMGF